MNKVFAFSTASDAGHVVRFVEEDRTGRRVRPGFGVLSEELDASNSPVLFGCRTGLCGTCVVEVVEGAQHLAPPNEEEREILDIYAEGRPHARLACQLDVQGDIVLAVLPKPDGANR